MNSRAAREEEADGGVTGPRRFAGRRMGEGVGRRVLFWGESRMEKRK